LFRVHNRNKGMLEDTALLGGKRKDGEKTDRSCCPAWSMCGHEGLARSHFYVMCFNLLFGLCALAFMAAGYIGYLDEPDLSKVLPWSEGTGDEIVIEGLGTVEETYKAYASPAYLTREQVNADLTSYGWNNDEACKYGSSNNYCNHCNEALKGVSVLFVAATISWITTIAMYFLRTGKDANGCPRVTADISGVFSILSLASALLTYHQMCHIHLPNPLPFLEASTNVQSELKWEMGLGFKLLCIGAGVMSATTIVSLLTPISQDQGQKDFLNDGGIQERERYDEIDNHHGEREFDGQ